MLTGRSVSQIRVWDNFMGIAPWQESAKASPQTPQNEAESTERDCDNMGSLVEARDTQNHSV